MIFENRNFTSTKFHYEYIFMMSKYFYACVIYYISEASNEDNSGASSTTGIVVVTIIVSLCVVALVAALCLNRKKILPTKCLNGQFTMPKQTIAVSYLT